MIRLLLALMLLASPSFAATETVPAPLTIISLDIQTVTTGGTAVTAIAAGNHTAGGFLQNPKGASIDLCINLVAAASGTTSAGDLICIPPAGTFTVPPGIGSVSVVTSDSSHPFAGYGLKF